MNNQLVVDMWKDATETLAQVFTKTYFPDEVYGKDTWWAGGEIGDVFFVSDMCLQVDFMRHCLEDKISFDDVYEYYWDSVDAGMENKPFPNIRNWMKMK